MPRAKGAQKRVVHHSSIDDQNGCNEATSTRSGKKRKLSPMSKTPSSLTFSLEPEESPPEFSDLLSSFRTPSQKKGSLKPQQQLDDPVSKEETTQSSNKRTSRSSSTTTPSNPPSPTALLSKEPASHGEQLSPLTEKEHFLPTLPEASLSQVGGMDSTLQSIRKFVEAPLFHSEMFEGFGIQPPRGILLIGPPGCGKTLVANAIASDFNVPFYSIASTELVAAYSGESELKIRQLFQAAASRAPSIIFLDEIDAIAGKRENSQKDMEKRIVSQIIASLDGLQKKAVVVIAATNRPDSLDSSLRRTGRFDREVFLTVPTKEERIDILRVLTSKMTKEKDLKFEQLALETPGYVGADLSALAVEASMLAFERARQQQQQNEGRGHKGSSSSNGRLERRQSPEEKRGENLPCLTADDLKAALKLVQPSSKREGFATVPSVKWSEVGALKELREELHSSIVAPIQYSASFSAYGLRIGSGVLLFGPPGCGKTLLAKAVANEASANFISVKGPELLDKYIGDSEKAVRNVFLRANASAPCIIFFDELDALAPRRSSSGENSVTERVVNQLLTEMDGLNERKDVFIIGATNRPDMIDAALLRPGRLDKLLYVPLPSTKDRQDILKTATKKIPVDRKINFRLLANQCPRFSGADLQCLAKEAASLALKERNYDPTNPLVEERHFSMALEKVRASVSEEQEISYLKLRDQLLGRKK